MKRGRKKQNEEEDKAETNKTAQLNIFSAKLAYSSKPLGEYLANKAIGHLAK